MGEDGDCSLFLNNWNLNQVFYLRGKTTERRFAKLKSILIKRCTEEQVVEGLGVAFLD